jgi:hypothetical protein
MFANLLWSHCQSECKNHRKKENPHEVKLLDCDLMWKRFLLPDCPVNSREKGEHPSYSRAAHVSAADYCRLGLMLIKFSSVAAAIITAMPTRLTASCIASPSEMSDSAMWLANASRTPRQ